MRLTAAALALTVFLGATPAPAQANEQPLNRAEAVKRARTWAEKKVPYSQKGYKDGYRRDCSGFISYAWDLPENLVTWTLPKVTKRIGKDSLEPGDILLNAKGGKGGNHVVMFDGWVNKSRTTYWAIEQTGQNGVRKTVRRKMPYPYKFDKHLYEPRRYVSMDGYWKAFPDKSQRQPVKGYNGRVVVPGSEKAKAIAEKKSAEAKAAAEAKKAEDAQTAAEAKAAAEKAELEQRIAEAKAEQAKRQAELREAAQKAAAAKRAAAAEHEAAETARAAARADGPADDSVTSVSDAVSTVALESAKQIVSMIVGSLQGQTQ